MNSQNNFPNNAPIYGAVVVAVVALIAGAVILIVDKSNGASSVGLLIAFIGPVVIGLLNMAKISNVETKVDGHLSAQTDLLTKSLDVASSAITRPQIKEAMQEAMADRRATDPEHGGTNGNPST